MKSISTYVNESLSIDTSIDGHVHCIGGEEFKSTAIFRVCALNDWPDQPREVNYPEFEKWFDLISNLPTKQDITLGIGANKDEMLRMLSDDRFSGYGEILVNKLTNDGTRVRDIEMAKFVLSKTSKPVYIHYELTEDSIRDIENLLNQFPNSKIVLCHCGLSRHTDDDTAYKLFYHLINRYDNLWGDISWHTLTYFIDNQDLMLKLPNDRIFCGTDCSERDSETAINHRIKNFYILKNLIPSDSNIIKLFKR